MLKFIFRLLFWSCLAVIGIRVFIPDSPLYEDYIAPFTEPIFQSILDEIDTSSLTENNTENNKQQDEKNIPIEENEPKELNNEEEQEDSNDDENISPIKACASKIPSANYSKSWQDISNKYRFSTAISIKSETVCASNLNRENLEIEYTDQQSYWQDVYGSLIKKDSPKLNSIFNRFKNIQKKQSLDYAEFAEMVVTFIQNIPYTLILEATAEEASKQSSFARNYIQKKQGPYIENIKFGLQSPIEFLYNLKGDCDTRTVLAYTILSHFGYDVAVINNSTHSMLGINLPTQGSYFPLNGKKYVLWETTAKNWQLGNISPEMLQDKTWYIGLPSSNDL